ncbi:hypothetical protein EGY25_13555 [Brevundimonas intermedia]|uniref:Uncharacterized protein n=1 Tax=Brevundimonas intermedia TaxID=74315 RepID=A0A4Y9RVK0_9CAUL|nr:hypothetical protein EGY25_13555 [Brevundimonas intermedia]
MQVQEILPRSSRGRGTIRRMVEGADQRPVCGVAPSTASRSPSPAARWRIMRPVPFSSAAPRPAPSSSHARWSYASGRYAAA